MREVYADIIIDISHEALDKVFQYRVPFSLAREITIGSQVLVPFGKGNRERTGYVIALKNKPSLDPSLLKEVKGILPGGKSVETELIRVAGFLRRNYACSMPQAMKTVMPVKVQVKHKQQTRITLACDKVKARELLTLWEKRHYTSMASFFKTLLLQGEISKEVAVKQCKMSGKKLKELEEEGLIHCESSVTYRNPFQHFSKADHRIPLNADQETLVDAFCQDYEKGVRKTYLLHGITGSGKTEVYLALIEEMIQQGRESIVLIPEISLTFQTVRRFYERFGDRIAVIHSKMSKGEKSDAVSRIENGQADIVIGARSALFAPVKHLGLIIIDEEHDQAYKSDSSPKYHARETAIFRAKLAEASVVLGSATPSMEAYSRAMTGEYSLWQLTKRPVHASLPQVSIVDLKEEFQKGNQSIFSMELQEKILDRLQKKEQIILFLNRRGYAGFVSCRSCGQPMKCPHCDISLTYHRNGKLVCHYCGWERGFENRCPNCHSQHVAAFGLGTEKVEAAIHALFPQARVLRMDADTTKRKNAHSEILESFGKGDADILLGTQMIVKGHDYENVTLVGIVAADLSLHSPDFRGAERTFQLLCQAAGRAGRGKKAGEVVIQTMSPDHYAIQASASQSFEDFYKEEALFRKMMNYPPNSHMMVLLIQSNEERAAIIAQQQIVGMLEKSQEKEVEPVQIMNPGQAGVAKIKDIYRRVIYLRHKEDKVLVNLRERLSLVLDRHEAFRGITVHFDLDPLSSY